MSLFQDEGGVMRCLIEVKMRKDSGLDEQCTTAIDHWQILSLKDWRFSAKFKKACQKEVKGICEP